MAAMDAFDKVLHEATNGPNDGKKLQNGSMVAADKNGSERTRHGESPPADTFPGRILHTVSSGVYTPSPIWVKRLPSEGTSVTTEPVSEQTADSQPFSADTVCWIASMTKLMTTVSAVQCVERGLIGLDDDVAEKILPEFRDINVLEAMEDDGNGGERPRLRKAKGKITLRHVEYLCFTLRGSSNGFVETC